MSLSAASSPPASILVVDDDRRVVELLSIALTAYGYRVLQAADGDEALRVALRERPDLIVLDVRLPRRSGLEVCERLRQDPEDPHVPIIMVSAAAETESRLQGLARGADDYVSKPFSPKELIARIRRLLARVAESRDARRRGLEAQQELHSAREEARRNHAGFRGEQRLRELAHTLVREFHGLVDPDDLSARLLLVAQSQLGIGMDALFVPDSPGGTLRVAAVRGELFECLRALEIHGESEFARLLSGLGRAVRMREFERFSDLRADTVPLAAAGFTVLAPVCGPDGIEGIFAGAERVDGNDLSRTDLDVLAVLCETAGLALHGAHRARAQAEGLVDALVAMAQDGLRSGEPAAIGEALDWIGPAAGETLVSHERARLERAVRLAPWAQTAAGRAALDRVAERDPSGWTARLLRLFDLAREGRAPGADTVAGGELRAAGLLCAARTFVEARLLGLSPAAAAQRSLARARALLDAGGVGCFDALRG